MGPDGILAALAVPGAVPVGGGDLTYAYPLLHKGRPHSLAPGADSYLLVDVGEVALDRGWGEVELFGYSLVGEAAGRQHQDLRLPLRERSFGLLAQPLDEAAGHRDHHFLPARRSLVAQGVDGGHQLFF